MFTTKELIKLHQLCSNEIRKQNRALDKAGIDFIKRSVINDEIETLTKCQIKLAENVKKEIENEGSN